MPTVTVKMSEAQFAALKREATARRTSKAGLLREAFLHRHDKAAGDSAFELISDLVGTVHGPTDLATNPKYLRTYGRSRRARPK